MTVNWHYLKEGAFSSLAHDNHRKISVKGESTRKREYIIHRLRVYHILNCLNIRDTCHCAIA